jgi:hypothetical protein
MFSLMIGLTATGIAASVGIGLARSKQQQRDARRALGRTPSARDAGESAVNRRAMREFAAVDRRIRERSPHLSAEQRRELALNLIRARGLMLEEARREH